MEYIFSERIKALKPSAIREILKATSNPDIIPLAAGNPAPEAFPIDAVREISADIFQNEPVLALQYGVTEGFEPLRETVLQYMKEKHSIAARDDSILITSGAQQVMELAVKVLCNEGDVCICENPSFIGSLNSFRSIKVNLAGVELEDDGMDMDELEKAVLSEKNVKLIYTIPNFQNPSGVTMSLEKRKRLYEIAQKYNLIIIEDNPYGDLRVFGEHIPSIKSMDTDGRVIYAGSFSKILAPGIRVGYAIANNAIISKMTVAKQGEDVHTPILSQLLVYKWMTGYDFEKHIRYIQDIYRKKLNLMCGLIDSELSDFVDYTKPDGGLFVWCKIINPAVDMLDFCKLAVENKVAIVPGTAFMVDTGASTNAFRLNFSTPKDEGITEGLKILGRLSKQI